MKNIQTVNKNPSKHRPLTLITNCTIGIYALLLFIAGMYPSAENWGIHHLAFYPPYVRFCLPLFILLLLIPAVRRFLIRQMEKAADYIGKQKKSIRYQLVFIALAASCAIFWVGKTATHFLGDGYLLIRSVQATINDPRLATHAFDHEPFVGFVIFNLHKIFSALDITDSIEFTYRALSILSGLTFIVLVWYLTGHISKERVERALILLFFLASGASQLFFGYIENYALAYIVIILFIIVSFLYLQHKVAIILPIIIFSFLVVIHLGAIVFFPAFIPLVLASYRRKEIRKTTLWCIVGVILIPVLLWISDYTPEMILKGFGAGSGQLVPLTKSSSIYHAYTLFSIGHIIDVFNLLFLLQPTAFILLFASGWLWRRQKKGSEEKLFLIFMVLCGGAFIFLVNCELGMSRDWDVLGPFSVVFSVAAIYGWFREIDDPFERRNLLVALTAIALLQTVLWIGINANEKKSLQRLDFLQEDPHWSIRAKYNLIEERAIFHRERKEFAKAALFYKQAVDLQPTHFRFLVNLAEIYLTIGDTLKAIDMYERIENQRQANAGIYLNLGILYFQYQRYGDALRQWYLAETLDSTSVDIPVNIGATIVLHEYSRERALPYFLKAIKRDSLCLQAYYYAAHCYEDLGEIVLARKYYARFAELDRKQRIK